MLIADYRLVVANLGVAMADRMRGDLDDADEIVARSVADLQLAGVSDSAIAAALLVRSIMLWSKESHTDDWPAPIRWPGSNLMHRGLGGYG